MDNVTHTLYGLALGETFLRLKNSYEPISNKKIKLGFLLISVIANNLPDLDILYAPYFAQEKISYLLHHRGHTHTFALAFIQALLLYWVFEGWLQKKGLTKKDRIYLFMLSVLGLFSHILLDSLNSYGVHPFWPFSNRWFYGDAVFILEPTIWLVLIPALFFMHTHKVYRTVMIALVVAIFTICFATQRVPISIVVSLLVLEAVLFYVNFKLKVQSKLALLWILLLSVVSSFNIISSQVRKELISSFFTKYPSKNLNDIVLSPFPANPFCWNTVIVSEDKQVIEMRKGIFANYPNILSQEACAKVALLPDPKDLKEEIYLEPQMGKVKVVEVISNDLLKLKADNCEVDAYLRFARLPYLTTEAGKTVINDLRFSRSGRAGFARVELLPNAICPTWVPPWEEPFIF